MFSRWFISPQTRKRKKERNGKNPRFRCDTQSYTRSEVRVSKSSDGFVGTGCLYLTFSFLGDSRTHVNQITVIRLSVYRLATFAHSLDISRQNDSRADGFIFRSREVICAIFYGLSSQPSSAASELIT